MLSDTRQPDILGSIFKDPVLRNTNRFLCLIHMDEENFLIITNRNKSEDKPNHYLNRRNMREVRRVADARKS